MSNSIGSGIFVLLRRRCQPARRAGGIDVGLIFWLLFYQEKSSGNYL
ncbi:MAG: hypothetical protein MJZ52_05350 [Bacteroidales bacterium]|nr:hypothetical protein [Bacteroidales bacterium]